MREYARDFKGIWIPKELWLDSDLPIIEKVLLVEIQSLEKNKECFASNSYFAEFFNMSKSRISHLICNLQKKKYIEIQLIYKGKQVIKRIIRTTDPIAKIAIGYCENNQDIKTNNINTKEDTKENTLKLEILKESDFTNKSIKTSPIKKNNKNSKEKSNTVSPKNKINPPTPLATPTEVPQTTYSTKLKKSKLRTNVERHKSYYTTQFNKPFTKIMKELEKQSASVIYKIARCYIEEHDLDYSLEFREDPMDILTTEFSNEQIKEAYQQDKQDAYNKILDKNIKEELEKLTSKQYKEVLAFSEEEEEVEKFKQYIGI